MAARNLVFFGKGLSISNPDGVAGNPTIALTNNVNGYGALNYVSKWNSTNNLVNSVLFDNGASIGIGTTSSL